LECTLIYRGWKRNTLSLLRTNIGPWFEQEGSQPLVQSCYHGIKKLIAKGCLSCPFLEWRRGGCRYSWLARPTIRCSTMSGYHGGVWFVRFGWEMKHSMFLKSRHLDSFFRWPEKRRWAITRRCIMWSFFLLFKTVLFWTFYGSNLRI